MRGGRAEQADSGRAWAARPLASSPVVRLLVVATGLAGSVEWADGWDCQPDVGDTCQVRRGPSSGQSYADWVAQYQSWREKGRAAFDFAAYDTPELAWARTSFVQAQAMVHDRFLYDRGAHKWTVDRYMDDVKSRYGGIDSVLLWHFYPNAGIDARNSFDLIDSLPGGRVAVKQLVADFHRHGVRVLWPFFPWDVGTHDTGQPQYVAQVGWMAELDADGFNGDTSPGVNSSFWREASRRHVPLAIEAEMLGFSAQRWDGTGLATNVMSWGYWPYQQVPVVDAFKTLEPRHLTHICERWARDRIDGLQHAFFNGIGYESWENIWGVFNKISDFDAVLLKRAAIILRGMGGITSNTNTEFNPHVPYTCADVGGLPDCSSTAPGVFMSEFKNDTTALYTIVNRNSTSKELGVGFDGFGEGNFSDLHLSLPCQKGMRFFNLYEGLPLSPPAGSKEICRGCENDVNGSCVGRVAFSVHIEPSGIGAVASMVTTSPDYAERLVAIENVLHKMSVEMQQPSLSRLNKVSRPLQQSIILSPGTPIIPLAPPGMVTVPSGPYFYESSNNCIEGDQLADAVGVQMPWQGHPSRSQKQLIRMHSFHIDKHLVTNEQYRRYVDRGAGKYFAPRDRQNWLKDWPGGLIPTGASNHPVRWVSRADASSYCRYYGKRLPTSWEWQYAAQGTDGRRYPWGNTWDASLVARLSNARDDPPTEDVDAHPESASPFGVEDMVGHLYQWTDEACDEHTCRAILRGGSNYYAIGSPWYFPQPGCVNGACHEDTPRGDLGVHNTLLLQSDPMDRSASIGFRCVVDAEPPQHECVFQLCGSLEARMTGPNGMKPNWSNDTNHDLTTEGTAGWITWGPDPDCFSPEPEECAPVTNEKRGFEHIVRATSVSGDKLIPYDHSPHTLAYSDGIGPLSATNIDTGVLVKGLNNGFAVHLPASLNTRTVAKLYVGVFSGRGELYIILNDGETQYLDSSLFGVTSMVSGVYTIEYETTDKWPIEVQWILSESTAEPRSGVEPAITLQAVTLSTRPVFPPKPRPSPAPDTPPPPASSSFRLASAAGAVLLGAGLLASLLAGVMCGRRCVWKKIETSHYELDDWAALEEPLRWQQDAPSGDDHWPSADLAELDLDLARSGRATAPAVSSEDVWQDDTGRPASRSERVV